jgi:acyl-CoA synthetase (AMP-forming)/AMP-acid ligase II
VLTAQRLYDRALRAAPGRIAVVDGDRRLTYADLDERSARLGNVLLAHGAGLDRPGAALFSNRSEFVEFDVACSRAGVTRVGISDRLSGDECRYILEHSQAAVLVTTPDLLERIDELPETLEALVLIDGDADRGAARRTLEYEAALAVAAPRLDVEPVAPGAWNYILYTSGTTGRPKGAAHSHAGRVASTVNMLASELRVADGFVLVHAAPLTHGSGSKMIAVLAAGGTNVILRKFDPEVFGTLVATEGGTHTFLVPTMLQRLLEAGPHVVSAVASMRQISFGGSPISSTLFARAIDQLGPILTQVYGSCEAPHPVTLLSPSDYGQGDEERVLTSAGRAAVGVDVKVVDDEERELAPGEVGELLVRGHNLMHGYWRDEEATAAVFTADGWYRTGDLASIDVDGLVTFRDRKRDLIISGGLNVYPSEVERVLAEHPGVREVAVVGYPDDEWGESVLAYVVPADGWDASPDDLIDWSRDRLAGYKKPRRVEFLERLPLGSSNKVLKKELRDALWQGRERRVN